MSNFQKQKINELAKKFASYNNADIKTFEKNFPKMTLPSSVDFEMKPDNKIVVHFGKNGYGLTTELKEIGEFVERLSKSARVYIEDVWIDSVDDVYDITFKYFYF